jgi:hypothetical protein
MKENERNEIFELLGRYESTILQKEQYYIRKQAAKWKEVDKEWMDSVVDFIHDEMGIEECRIIWQEEKTFISRDTGAFLTKRACKEYIERFGYNHYKPHTYAMTAYRNFELERLLKILRFGLDFNNKEE